MPESVISDHYVDQIPRFVLPKEFSNPEPKDVEVKDKAAPPPEAKEAPKPPVAEAATPEPKSEPETAAETPEKEEKATSRPFERRIDRAHRRAAEAQARAELLEKEVNELRAKSAPQPRVDAPKMDQFNDISEYEKAVRAHERKAAEEDFQKQSAETQRKTEAEKLSKDWESKVAEAEDKYEDFRELVGELKPTTPWSVAIMASENGGDIAYHLAKNAQEARRIFQLPPYSQMLEIGKLSVKLAAPPQEKPRTPSKAPAPITPVNAEAKPSGDEIRENQPFEEYRKIGNKMFRRS